jgi:hypothetical protein
MTFPAPRARGPFVESAWTGNGWATEERRQLQPVKECAMRAKRLTLQQRREIFHTLVLTQDMVNNVPRSRQIVTEKYDITEAQLRQIEDEGLEKEWPPLSEAVQEQEVS